MNLAKLTRPAARGRLEYIERDGTGTGDPRRDAQIADIQESMRKAIDGSCVDGSRISNLVQERVEKSVAEALHQWAQRNPNADLSDSPVLRVLERVANATETEGDASIVVPVMTREQRELIMRAKRDPRLLPELRKQQVRFIERAVSADNTDVAGGVRTSLMAYTPMSIENSFMGYVDERTIPGGTAKIPIVGTITLVKEANDNQSRTEVGGVLSDLDVTLPTGVNQCSASLASLNDVRGLQNSVSTAAMRSYGRFAGSEIHAAVKASANGANGITAIKTGVAAGLPTAANVLARLDEMISSVAAAYRGNCSLHISRKVEELMNKHSASSGDYAWDVSEGIRRFRSYPVQINDSFEDGDAANEVSALFGDLYSGIVQVNGNPLVLGRLMMETQPGRGTFFTSARVTGIVQDGSAMAALSTGT